MKKLDALYSSETVEWETPQDFFDKLNDEFHFTLDPCCTDENAKCEKHYTQEQDGLAQDWTGETVYCNPPYGRSIHKWIQKCYEHHENGGVAVMLIQREVYCCTCKKDIRPVWTMRKDNRLWFQGMRISIEILSNVWKKDSKEIGEANG